LDKDFLFFLLTKKKKGLYYLDNWTKYTDLKLSIYKLGSSTNELKTKQRHNKTLREKGFWFFFFLF